MGQVPEACRLMPTESVTDAGLRLVLALTAREREAMALMCTESATLAEIGRQMGISAETAKRYRSIVFEKSGMGSRLELALFAFRNGVLPCPCGATVPMED